jgi:hypothetical protein
MNYLRFARVSAPLYACAFLACSGSDGAPGKDGVTATSVNGISPARAFVGRKVTLTISGFGTNWDKANKPAVDFGDAAITVAPEDVTVASPTALVVVATIGASAKIEKKAIKVGNKDTFEGFSVESPVDIVTEGIVAQGSIAKVSLRNRDVSENLFDDTSVSGGLFAPPTFTNFVIEAGTGGKASDQVRVLLQSLNFVKAEAVMLTNVNAPAGKLDITAKSGPKGAALDFASPGSFDIAARSAQPLTSGTPASGKVEKPYDSALFSFKPAAGDTLNFLGVAAGGAGAADASPSLFVLPASGSFATLGSAGYSIGNNAPASYAVLWDNSGAAGYTYRVTATSAPATLVTESASNDTAATALEVTAFPSILKSADLSSPTDQDWFKVTLATSKKIAFGTLAGDPECDTVVTVYSADGTTEVGAPSDDDFHEAVVTSTLNAGTYFVKVSASRTFKVAKNRYAAYLTVQ